MVEKHERKRDRRVREREGLKEGGQKERKRKMTGKERKGKKQEWGQRLAGGEKGMEEGRHFTFLGRNNTRPFTVS